MTKEELEEEINKAEKQLESDERLAIREQNKLKGQIRLFTNFAWTFVIIGFCVVIIGLYLYLQKPPQGEYGLNLIGDFMAGTVASLWSLAGLFFIYVAFLGQRLQISGQELELKHSRLEVKYTRFELHGQKAEMALQNNTLQKQRFENTFFQLISVQHDIIDKIEVYDYSTKLTSRAALSHLKHNLEQRLKSRVLSLALNGSPYHERDEEKIEKERDKIMARLSNEQKLAEPLIRTAFKEFWEEAATFLSHYFRNLYHCFKYIWNSNDLNNEQKKEYASLLRAQLSPAELYLLIFNSLIEGLGKPKFLFLIKEFDIDQNRSKDDYEDYQIKIFDNLKENTYNPFLND